MNAISQGEQPQLTIRRATEADVPDIMQIERTSFPSPWSEWGMRAEITYIRGRIYLVAILDGHLVAYLGGRRAADTCHIGTIAVDPTRRRQGIGEGILLVLLLHLVEQNTKEVTLEYRTDNTAARRLYQKVGFTHLRTSRGYYRDTGEDAHEMAISDLHQTQRHQNLGQQWQQWRQRHQYELEIVL